MDELVDFLDMMEKRAKAAGSRMDAAAASGDPITVASESFGLENGLRKNIVPLMGRDDAVMAANDPAYLEAIIQCNVLANGVADFITGEEH